MMTILLMSVVVQAQDVLRLTDTTTFNHVTVITNNLTMYSDSVTIITDNGINDNVIITDAKGYRAYYNREGEWKEIREHDEGYRVALFLDANKDTAYIAINNMFDERPVVMLKDNVNTSMIFTRR